MREGEAPSYFNAVEAAVLVELVEGLLASVQKAGARGVRPDDLGVMATYRKQVCWRGLIRPFPAHTIIITGVATCSLGPSGIHMGV